MCDLSFRTKWVPTSGKSFNPLKAVEKNDQCLKISVFILGTMFFWCFFSLVLQRIEKIHFSFFYVIICFSFLASIHTIYTCHSALNARNLVLFSIHLLLCNVETVV